MRDYRRSDPAFSLCGLCCALCPMHRMEKGCPGCGGGEGHQSCAVIRCALAHGGPESCAFCPGYPCPRLTEAAQRFKCSSWFRWGTKESKRAASVSRGQG